MVRAGDHRLAGDVPACRGRRLALLLGLRDRSGAYLDGGKRYSLTVPLPVPGKLFWSITVYDAETRSQIQTEQDKAALRSRFELKDLDGLKSGAAHGPMRAEGARDHMGPNSPHAVVRLHPHLRT